MNSRYLTRRFICISILRSFTLLSHKRKLEGALVLVCLAGPLAAEPDEQRSKHLRHLHSYLQSPPLHNKYDRQAGFAVFHHIIHGREPPTSHHLLHLGRLETHRLGRKVRIALSPLMCLLVSVQEDLH